MEEGSQDLLGVTISPWGMTQLKRLANNTRWTFLAGILLTLIYIVNGFVQRTVLQLYLFLIFSRKSAAACEKVDSFGFNESLGLLTRYNRVALLTILMNLVFAALEMWSSFNFLAIRLHNSG